LQSEPKPRRQEDAHIRRKATPAVSLKGRIFDGKQTQDSNQKTQMGKFADPRLLVKASWEASLEARKGEKWAKKMTSAEIAKCKAHYLFTSTSCQSARTIARQLTSLVLALIQS